MSRETQGLQVALIVFAVLAVVLSVTTLVFFRQSTAAVKEAEAWREEAGTMRVAVRSMQEEGAELRRMIGFAPTQKFEAVRQEFAEDVRAYAANYPEETRRYRPLLAYQNHVIGSKNTQLAEAKQEIQGWKDRFRRLERSKQVRVDQFEAAAVAARDAMRNERVTTEKARDYMLEQTDSMHQALLRIRQEADRARADAKQKADELQRKYQKVLRENEILRKKNRKPGVSRVADGRVFGVSPRFHLAWVDLGLADSLEPAVPFDVHPAEAARLDPSTKKGVIEITRVLGNHMAEARVMEENITDPILRGDKIHSTSWRRQP